MAPKVEVLTLQAISSFEAVRGHGKVGDVFVTLKLSMSGENCVITLERERLAALASGTMLVVRYRKSGCATVLEPWFMDVPEVHPTSATVSLVWPMPTELASRTLNAIYDGLSFYNTSMWLAAATKKQKDALEVVEELGSFVGRLEGKEH